MSLITYYNNRCKKNYGGVSRKGGAKYRVRSNKMCQVVSDGMVLRCGVISLTIRLVIAVSIFNTRYHRN
jgi:hypothetical protein